MRALSLYLIDAGLSLGTAATIAGLLAPWWPALELINHFRPFLAVGGSLLLILSLGLRSRRLAATAVVLVAVNLALVIVPALRYGAPDDPAAEPNLRVATLNTWIMKGQANRIIDFIIQADADVILLQEVGQGDQAAVLNQLASTYPYVLFDEHSRSGPALLSKWRWSDSGIIPTGRGRPLSVWARFDQDGRLFEIASVHAANPFEWRYQPGDVDRLIRFARSRRAPLILGGDFNLTPFSWKLIKLAEWADLRWGQTFAASWPANWLIPIVLLDHVLVSKGVVLTAVETGPLVGSDHLPVVAHLIVEDRQTGAGD